MLGGRWSGDEENGGGKRSQQMARTERERESEREDGTRKKMPLFLPHGLWSCLAESAAGDRRPRVLNVVECWRLRGSTECCRPLQTAIQTRSHFFLKNSSVHRHPFTLRAQAALDTMDSGCRQTVSRSLGCRSRATCHTLGDLWCTLAVDNTWISCMMYWRAVEGRKIPPCGSCLLLGSWSSSSLPLHGLALYVDGRRYFTEFIVKEWNTMCAWLRGEFCPALPSPVPVQTLWNP